MDNYITLEHLDQTIWSLLQKIDSKEDNRITNGDIQNWNNKSDFNGDYNNLINKPSQPDWEINGSILNKPQIFAGTGDDSIREALGIASGDYAHAEGDFTQANGYSSHAEGSMTYALGAYSHAEGCSTTASGFQSHAEGYRTIASGDGSHAEGYKTTASEVYSHAEGYETTASGVYSHAENQGEASGIASHAEGSGRAIGNYSHAEGAATTASGVYSHAEGSNTIASGSMSHTEGDNTQAKNSAAHAEGSVTIASGQGSHAEGCRTIAEGQNSHAEGYGTTANGWASHVEGWKTLTSGTAAHAEGYLTQAFGMNAHAEGQQTFAIGQASHSEGNSTTATGAHAHAEGWKTFAAGTAAHAEGYSTTASGSFSHAEGNITIASGSYSHAEGTGTEALGNDSHAEGYSTKASGDYSHAEGWKTEAIGKHSHAEGFSTFAQRKSQHVFGEYNILDTAGGGANIRGDYVEIVGNGSSSASRANARTLDWNGNEVLAGKLTVGIAPSNNMDVATKKYVDDNLSGYLPTSITATGGQVSITATPGATSKFAVNLTGAAGTSSGRLTFESSSNNTQLTLMANKGLSIIPAAGYPGLTLSSTTISGLSNPTTATDAANKKYVDDTVSSAIGSVNSFNVLVVQTLPTSNIDDHTIYFISNNGDTGNIYDEYMYINSNWEKLGTTEIDLSGYVQKQSGNNGTLYSNYIGTLISNDNGSLYLSHFDDIEEAEAGIHIDEQGLDLFGMPNKNKPVTIRGLATPSDNYDATNKQYVDNAISSIPSQVQSNWTEASTTNAAYILNKPAIIASATGTNAIIEGNLLTNKAIGNYSHAEGTTTIASGLASHAEGAGTTASGANSHAEGYGTIASANTAHAEGYGTIASGAYTHAEGASTQAIGNQSHAEGGSTQANGNQSHAEGSLTKAVAIISHAEGYMTYTLGIASHAEGNTTTASGAYSHTEGYKTFTAGTASHAEGINTQATGNWSHAEGNHTIAQKQSQHVFGEYNIADTTGGEGTKGTYVEIVGNGTSTTAANARTLDWDGNEWLAGKLTVSTSPTANMDVTTKEYVDNLEAKKALSIPIATVDSTSTATAFTVQVPEFENETQLRDGLFFYITNDVIASASGWTLQVNDFIAKPVYNASRSRVTTGFALNRSFPCWYDSSLESGEGAWVIGYITDTDTNTDTIAYSVRTNNQTLPVTDKFYRYRLLFTSADNEHLVPANTSSSTNATANRTPNQKPINPFGPIFYYGSTTAVNANANPTATVLWRQYAVALGYSFAKGAALTMTLYKPVYLKCAPQSDGSAIIDSTTPWVQDLPTTNDGKIYIFLGVAYSATNIDLMLEHPVYYYDGESIKLWPGCRIPIAETTNNVNSMLASLGLNANINLQAAAAGTAETDTAVVM